MQLNVSSIITTLALTLSAFVYARGAVINVSAGGDIAGAVSSANPCDTVQLAAGTFTVSAPISVPSGVSILGTSCNSTHVIFTLAGGENSMYAFVISGGAKNVGIAQMDIVSNHGVVNMAAGRGYQNITIAWNNLQYGGGSYADGTLVFGIYGTVANEGLQITHNYFHDSPNSVRNWSIWYASNANLDYNLFYNVNDGGQLDEPGDNVSFSYNYGTLLHRMGQEVYVGGDSSFLCTGNVFYDYVNPYYDTEGVSVVGGTGDVEISDNYFAATIADGSTWGQADSGGTHRFGYAIEATGGPGLVTDNTIVGVWAECVSSDMKNANVTKNTVFGHGMWGNFMGEPGPLGSGSVKATNNTIDSTVADAPAPPDNAHAGPHRHSH